MRSSSTTLEIFGYAVAAVSAASMWNYVFSFNTILGDLSRSLLAALHTLLGLSEWSKFVVKSRLRDELI